MESIYFDQMSLTLAGIVILVAAGYTAHSQIRFADIPGNLPWVGKQNGFLADLRTRIGTMGNILPAMQTGYDKVGHLIPIQKTITSLQLQTVFESRHQLYTPDLRRSIRPPPKVADQLDHQSA